MKHTYPKTARLRERSEFRRISATAKRVAGKWIVLQVAPNRYKQPRLGISASKKYGRAHERNRFKRLVRESFRLARSSIPDPVDIHVRPRTSAKRAGMNQIRNELLMLVGLLRDRIKTTCTLSEERDASDAVQNDEGIVKAPIPEEFCAADGASQPSESVQVVFIRSLKAGS